MLRDSRCGGICGCECVLVQRVCLCTFCVCVSVAFARDDQTDGRCDTRWWQAPQNNRRHMCHHVHVFHMRQTGGAGLVACTRGRANGQDTQLLYARRNRGANTSVRACSTHHNSQDSDLLEQGYNINSSILCMYRTQSTKSLNLKKNR